MMKLFIQIKVKIFIQVSKNKKDLILLKFKKTKPKILNFHFTIIMKKIMKYYVNKLL